MPKQIKEFCAHPRSKHLKSHLGRLERIEKIGLGIVVDEINKEEYPFTLDKVEGYRGESLKELHLKRGNQVQFILHNGKIVSVKPADRLRHNNSRNASKTLLRHRS